MRSIGRVVLVILISVVASYGQTFRGAINGTVIDQSGAVVFGASVKATNEATAVTLSTATTSDGAFEFQDLPLGTYRILVSASGFRTQTIDNVTVLAGKIYTIPITLSVGASATAMEVSAAALTIDTTTATQSDTITETAVQQMPLNGRDFSQLIAVTPGYAGYSVGGFGSLNGTRANQMNWQLDGTDNNDFWHNIPAINESGVAGIAGTVMPIDAIEQFSSQSQSNAETGRSAGGTNNLIIRSGTNQLHGTVYYYNRNEYYAASSPFFVPSADFPRAPELRDENEGFTFGGPIKKEKAFFFLGFERQNYIFGLTGLSTEPSNAWVTNALALLNNAGGVYGSYASVTPSPVSQALLANLWPSSIRNLAATTSNYFATVPGTGFSYNGLVKLDYNFNDNNHLSVHGFYGIGTQTQPLGASLALATASSNLGYYFQVAPTIAQNYSAVLNSIFNPRLSNQVLFGIGVFHQIYHDADNTFNLRSLGLYTSPDAVLENGQPIMGAPNIVIGPTGSTFDQIGITPPEGRDSATGHVGDVISYVVGKHQFRFGGEFRQGHVDESYYRRSTGVFDFLGIGNQTNGTQGGPWDTTCLQTQFSGLAGCSAYTTALADFLAGDVAQSSIAVGDAPRNVVVNGLDFFGQDAWQVTRKLNLNLGLRYEYIGPLHNGNKDLAVFIPDRGLFLQGNGIDSIFPPRRHNFAPRFGFAYEPGENLVVRGGVGVFFDQVNMNPFLDFRPPVSGADGLADNPIGPHAVANYSTNRLGQTSYDWDVIQAGGNSIFPGLITCPTLSGCMIPGTSQLVNYNVYSVNQDLGTPYFYNYNLQLEKGFANGAAVLQVGYVGSVGHKLLVMDSIAPCITLNPCPFTNVPTPQFQSIDSVLQLNSVGNSNYNSLQTTLKMRSWHGLSSQFAYTWGHELDTMTEYRGNVQWNNANPRLDYGSGDFDTRQNFTAFFTYDIPGSSYGPRLLTHDWQVSSLMSFHSGQPFNFPGIDASGTQRPGLDLIANPFAGISRTFSKNLGGEPGEQWVNPAAFCIPDSSPGVGNCPVGAPTSINGDLGRNAFTGPGFADVDLSVIKNIPVRERVKLQLRAEMFNVFNRKNLASGAGSVGSDGTVRDTIGDFNGAPGLGPGEPFNMQLAAKIIF